MNRGVHEFREAPAPLAPPAAIGLLAGLLITMAASAAPVLSTDDDSAAGSGGTGAAVVQVPAASQPIGTMVLPEASTGNKNLDLLLELQGRPEQETQRPRSAASAAAAAAAASALAELRAKAAQRPAPDPGVDRPQVQPFDGADTLGSDARAAQPPELREWIGGQGAAGDRVGYGGGAGYGQGGGEHGEKLLQGPLREAILFLRENRDWLLGGLVALAAIGAVLKAYSRRV